jgi:hypothetical protein
VATASQSPYSNELGDASERTQRRLETVIMSVGGLVRCPDSRQHPVKKTYLPTLFGLLILTILFSGCGGGGGGGGNGGNNGGTNGLNSIRAEAATAADPNAPIDPLNIQAGESIVFQVVGYTDAGVRQILPSANWTSSDNGNVSGILLPDGNLSASGSSGPSFFIASGVANGSTYSTNYRVKPVQAIVRALILDSNLKPAYHVGLAFYNAAGVEVSKGYSQYDGTVRVSTPTSAVSFSLDITTLPKSVYFRSYVHSGSRYSVLIAGCRTPLPALTNGTTTQLGTVTIDAAKTNGLQNPPPPPPDGCSTS